MISQRVDLQPVLSKLLSIMFLPVLPVEQKVLKPGKSVFLCQILCIWSCHQSCICVHMQSLGTKGTSHPVPTLQNNEPVSQVLKQILNLSCYQSFKILFICYRLVIGLKKLLCISQFLVLNMFILKLSNAKDTFLNKRHQHPNIKEI